MTMILVIGSLWGNVVQDLVLERLWAVIDAVVLCGRLGYFVSFVWVCEGGVQHWLHVLDVLPMAVMVLLVESFALARAVVREVHAKPEMTHGGRKRLDCRAGSFIEGEIFVLGLRLERAKLLNRRGYRRGLRLLRLASWRLQLHINALWICLFLFRDLLPADLPLHHASKPLLKFGWRGPFDVVFARSVDGVRSASLNYLQIGRCTSGLRLSILFAEGPHRHLSRKEMQHGLLVSFRFGLVTFILFRNAV